MYQKQPTWLCTITGLLCLGPVLSAGAQISDLFDRVPGDANAVMVIDVNAILESPLAQRKFWRQQLKLRSDSRQILVPPAATHYVMAARLAFPNLEPTWQIAVMELSHLPMMNEIAQREGGHADPVAGLEALSSPQDFYFVKFGRMTIGVQLPADRQWATQWAKDAQKMNLSRSAILNEAVTGVENSKTEIAIALDLEGMVSPGEIRPDLDSFTSLKGKGIDRNKVAELLASVKGLILNIDIEEEARGQLVVRLGQSVAPIASVAKPLLLEVMASAGASLDEIGSWEPTMSAESVSAGRRPDGQRAAAHWHLDLPPFTTRGREGCGCRVRGRSG